MCPWFSPRYKCISDLLSIIYLATASEWHCGLLLLSVLSVDCQLLSVLLITLRHGYPRSFHSSPSDHCQDREQGEPWKHDSCTRVCWGGGDWYSYCLPINTVNYSWLTIQLYTVSHSAVHKELLLLLVGGTWLVFSTSFSPALRRPQASIFSAQILPEQNKTKIIHTQIKTKPKTPFKKM